MCYNYLKFHQELNIGLLSSDSNSN